MASLDAGAGAAGRRRHAPASQGVIGPNIVIRTAESLTDTVGSELCAKVFGDAGLGRHLSHPPERMVSESEVAALYRALLAVVGEERACAVALRAGHLTGNYLLAHRIPRSAQRAIACLPRRIGAALLLGAIARHAWTFAGSGRFSYAWAPGLVLRIEDSPLCADARTSAPVRQFYAGAFERVLSAMLGQTLRVSEAPRPGPARADCSFQVRW